MGGFEWIKGNGKMMKSYNLKSKQYNKNGDTLIINFRNKYGFCVW